MVDGQWQTQVDLFSFCVRESPVCGEVNDLTRLLESGVWLTSSCTRCLTITPGLAAQMNCCGSKHVKTEASRGSWVMEDHN